MVRSLKPASAEVIERNRAREERLRKLGYQPVSDEQAALNLAVTLLYR